jgi:excisionase family DNA binding protein
MTHYNIPESSEKLKMSEAWIRQKIFKKEIRYLKIGRRVFIPKETIDEILSKSIVEPQK